MKTSRWSWGIWFWFLLMGILAPAWAGVDEFNKEAWDANNDPLNLDSALERNYNSLPTSAQLRKAPWADSYWPSQKGGIAYRWSSNRRSTYERLPFYYQTFSYRELKDMDKKEISLLSPAEKLDIYNGRYDYPTVAEERKRTSASNPSWFGLCHGWAAASVNYGEEPEPVTLRSRDGIKIPFGSSDVKALLAYSQAVLTKPLTKYLGTRCWVNLSEEPASGNKPECRDTNAGTFHVALTNLVGLQKRPLIADMTRDMEIWNFPIYSYTSSVQSRRRGASPGAAPGTVQEVSVKTLVKYTVALQAPYWEEIRGGMPKSKTYSYRLELDQGGRIIGGAWITQDRPDFLWVQEKAPLSGDYWAIEEIYRKSL